MSGKVQAPVPATTVRWGGGGGGAEGRPGRQGRDRLLSGKQAQKPKPSPKVTSPAQPQGLCLLRA